MKKILTKCAMFVGCVVFVGGLTWFVAFIEATL